MDQYKIDKLIHDFIVHPLRHYMPAHVWQPLHDWHSRDVVKFPQQPAPVKCKHCQDYRKDLQQCKHCTPQSEVAK